MKYLKSISSAILFSYSLTMSGIAYAGSPKPALPDSSKEIVRISDNKGNYGTIVIPKDQPYQKVTGRIRTEWFKPRIVEVSLEKPVPAQQVVIRDTCCSEKSIPKASKVTTRKHSIPRKSFYKQPTQDFKRDTLYLPNNTFMDRINERFDSLDRSIYDLEGRIDSIPNCSGTDSLESRLDVMNTNLTNLTTTYNNGDNKTLEWITLGVSTVTLGILIFDLNHHKHRHKKAELKGGQSYGDGIQ